MTAKVSWRARNGALWSVDGDTVEQVVDDARSLGWEGHPGGFWRYFKADLRRAWQRLRQ
jgi:hypothetical protein